MTTVRYAVLPAERIFNLTSPRYLPEISQGWQGKEPWHSEKYEPVRDLMERLYVDGFNEAAGHFRRLEESILAEGFRNPIMVSAGKLDRRKPSEIPPKLRAPGLIVSEYLGGSRLWVAQRHGLDVPCIVNDHRGVLPEAEVLGSLAAVLDRFTDRPAATNWSYRGVYLNNLPYMHLPESKRYGLAKQVQIRREIIRDVRQAVERWLHAHD